MSGGDHNQGEGRPVREPTRWPIDTSERWVCPECGERYAAAYSTALGQFGWVAGVSR